MARWRVGHNRGNKDRRIHKVRITMISIWALNCCRWSIDLSPGEKIYLRTYVRSYCAKDMGDFFLGSALSLAKDFGIAVHSLRLVSRAGFYINASLAVLEHSTVYYFAYPPNLDGSVPDPPGLWSLCPYPLCSKCHLHADVAQVCFHLEPLVDHERIIKPILAVLQDLESHGFVPVPDISYGSDPPFASITEVSEQQAPPSTVARRPKKRFGDVLLAAFSQKRKTS
ncbi:hypothetical protein SISSUDRAFT_1055467 [Sistotremastrum suecicum HHB10207 ss-3]|uniref:Uncharacterized protein n=1 Tax=Sistotremastrum suecicum HHB10207 ss-3 TaxID=1314776 RepID=A0A165XRT5_9AGAM|nr:hypothetical protein SISSUDRAFT_1055467 [Sistotremastrum suecicum HHB10207 ss-3]